jgi:hypothetical protein
MDAANLPGSKSTVLLIMVLTILSSSTILIILSQFGLVAFTGAGWIVSTLNSISGHLGYSVLFFIPVFTGFGIFFGLLASSLSRFESDPKKQIENIRYYNAGTEIFTLLSFAIGVLFTAWGLQNALVSALGNVGKEEAARLGAWGILKQLVENGFLVAFWTTIVGGTAGYLMRLFKFLRLGRKLARVSDWQREHDRQALLDVLSSIDFHLERVDKNITLTAQGVGYVRAE